MSSFKSLILVLLLLPADVWAVDKDEDKRPSEPKVLSVFPLGGRQGSDVLTEVRGSDFGGAYAVW